MFFSALCVSVSFLGAIIVSERGGGEVRYVDPRLRADEYRLEEDDGREPGIDIEQDENEEAGRVR